MHCYQYQGEGELVMLKANDVWWTTGFEKKVVVIVKNAMAPVIGRW